MSNLIHLLAQSDRNDLSGTIRDFKNYTSKKFLGVRNDGESRSEWMKKIFEYHGKFKSNQSFKVWTHENHAELIYSQNFIEQKLDYIHTNPIRAGIVANPEGYLYSSARNYAGLESVLEIVEVDRRWRTVR